MAGNDKLILPATVSFAALAMTCLHTLISSSLTVFLLLLKNPVDLNQYAFSYGF